MAYGDIDLDGNRSRAAAAVRAVQAVAERRPVPDPVDALARLRSMIPRVTDLEISRACEDEARRSDNALADCERWMASLRPAPAPPRRRRTVVEVTRDYPPPAGWAWIDTGTDIRAREIEALPVEISDIGGDDPDARARGDLAVDGFDVLEGDPGWDAVQDTGERVVTLSTGHGSESEAWAWLRRWVADRDAAPQPLDTSPG
jgi:hypothetical protein